MPCNLNFNQCNSFPSFPIPIFTCRQILFGLITSPNIIINPLSSSTFTAATQVLPAGGSLVFTLASGAGSGITLGADGITLSPGTYQITFSGSGTIPTGGTMSLALSQDGVINSSSIASVTGIVGTPATISNSVIISVPSTGSLVNIVNNLAESETISGNLTISRVL